MRESLTRWVLNHPYLTSGLVFLAVSAYGLFFLYWGDREFGFLLLLFFLVSLGIRLDDISRKIDRITEGKRVHPARVEAVVEKLAEIKAALEAIQSAIEKNGSKRGDHREGG